MDDLNLLLFCLDFLKLRIQESVDPAFISYPATHTAILHLFGEMGSTVGAFKNSAMVCAPLMAQSVEQMVIDMQSSKAQGADVVEVRLDCIDKFRPSQDLETIIRNKPLPVIMVYR